MVKNDFAEHFPELDLGEDDLASLGFSFCHISVFDHWLSAQEAADNPFMSYSIALDAGELEGYLQGEHKLLKFYSSLSSLGVICNRPSPLRVFEAFTAELEQIMISSLREKRLMDLYFKVAGVRVIGRYDRTDLVIADSMKQLDSLRLKVREFGLCELK
ncbi:hypothetical protein R1538_13215 [Rhizobium leguminosarum]|uniref:Uncharacterized protein n=1 Tax=Rhizobium leguminosarum TaxID=384 RepID=A0A7M3DLF7_RHILE|nr:hypothetical protein [Rhizobium leguminosarum]MBP2489549.1 hypothetical protein [Rhizobium leguminosarum]MDV4162077.1 hypothetical protein [Rhizobium leguminosarum]MDV4172456.1 hypothetical protein [Rhizobium leguminosarum]TAY43861.1 hypothetical protein ELH90_31710 [Rhizobium leguminosarum]WHO83939.1 hypothetical protein QMO81_006868 [Rhizobium leguminosarum]